ncbi:FG-GAP repeat protein [Streptomyces sp. NPDC102270]|uniref:FG-GAP repeat protein n=1 Tax=Streptomyces sp. NPDC102270 TaxID=3366150 RepID=UPI0038160DDE
MARQRLSLACHSTPGPHNLFRGRRVEPCVETRPVGRTSRLTERQYSTGKGPGTAPQWWSQNSPGLIGSPGEHDARGNDLSVSDVDGDGYADLAVGGPGEDADGEQRAGAVSLLRGSREGVTATGYQHFDQNTRGIPGAAEAGDGWGVQVRLIDGDGRAELVAAAPDENAGDGAVWLLPASGNGLLADGFGSYGAAALGGSAHGAHFGAVIDE